MPVPLKFLRSLAGRLRNRLCACGRTEAPSKPRRPATLDGLERSLSDSEKTLTERVRPFTMTGPERIVAAADAVRYLSRRGLDGDIVECGVWRGGSMMAMALTLMECGETNRGLWLFDTFEGMSPPSDLDRDWAGRSADELMNGADRETSAVWAVADYDDVHRNMESVGYPMESIRFIKGKVEDTLPANGPERIALLRLDTDWYDSTRHELRALFPRVVPGGVVIIDDYGHWTGCRKAVDEYLEEQRLTVLLHRIDYTGRMFVKG